MTGHWQSMRKPVPQRGLAAAIITIEREPGLLQVWTYGIFPVLFDEPANDNG